MNNQEEILGKVESFFEPGFYNLKYYDIYITNNRLVFIRMGESFKTWMLRADPGHNNREKYLNKEIDELFKKNINSFQIYLRDIEAIKLRKKNFMKNGYLLIKVKDREIELYSKAKKESYDYFYDVLANKLDINVNYKKVI